ncbi:hypothetical protein C8R43DRAFT_1242155 [Mycena crocata]|nr:hypothetical protein C8R43DRAFT_1242155 [Mycena crocata]
MSASIRLPEETDEVFHTRLLTWPLAKVGLLDVEDIQLYGRLRAEEKAEAARKAEEEKKREAEAREAEERKRRKEQEKAEARKAEEKKEKQKEKEKKRKAGTSDMEPAGGATKKSKAEVEKPCEYCEKHKLECIIERGRRACEFCRDRKVKCTRETSAISGSAIDSEQVEHFFRLMETAVGSLQAIETQEVQIDQRMTNIIDLLEILNNNVVNGMELVKAGLRLAHKEEADPEIKKFAERERLEIKKRKKNKDNGDKGEGSSKMRQ